MEREEFKLIVAGSRNFLNYVSAKEILTSVLSNKKLENVCIVSGGARGADKLGEVFASENKCNLKIFPANWDKYGKKAGYLRNREMIEFADATILFWDRESRGTKSMLMLTLDYNKPLFVVYFDPKTQRILECKDESNPF